MANTKPSIQKNVIYDSGNDVASGKKRAVDFTGGVSVAERARLFGAQIKQSSGPRNPPAQRPTGNRQQPPATTKPAATQPSYRANINRYPNPERNYVSPERISHQYESPSPFPTDETPTPEPIPTINSQTYSVVARPPYRHNQSAPVPQQRPYSFYDTFQSTIPKEPPPPPQLQQPIRQNYTHVVPGESQHVYNDDPYYEAYTRPQSLPVESNYFQPIQDPLQALYGNPTPIYSQPQIPTIVNNDNNLDDIKAFDLGNLINRIQQDYANNVRPYVSSVKFIEDDQILTSDGFATPTRSQKHYSRRNNDIYLRQGATYHYDIIDMNGAYPRFLNPRHNDKHYSSNKRRHRRRNYHDRALSPIHIFESSNKAPTPPPPSPPPPPVEKPPTPVEESSSEEEETSAANTKTEEAKTSEEESEDESSEAVSETPPKPAVEAPPSEPARPSLANPIVPASSRIPPKLVSSESSESEESESESESDSDDDDDDEKPKSKSAPAARQNNNRTAAATPQSNARGTPLRTATNVNNTTNQPPETSNSVQSFDLDESEKPAGVGGKFRSLFNKIRRK